MSDPWHEHFLPAPSQAPSHMSSESTRSTPLPASEGGDTPAPFNIYGDRGSTNKSYQGSIV